MIGPIVLLTLNISLTWSRDYPNQDPASSEQWVRFITSPWDWCGDIKWSFCQSMFLFNLHSSLLFTLILQLIRDTTAVSQHYNGAQWRVQTSGLNIILSMDSSPLFWDELYFSENYLYQTDETPVSVKPSCYLC